MSGGSKSNASTSTQQQDNRQVFGNDAVVAQSGGRVSTDNHQQLNSNNSTSRAYDDHSSRTTNYNVTDGGAFTLVDGVVQNSLHSVNDVASDALGRMASVSSAATSQAGDVTRGAFDLIDATVRNVTGHADSMLTQSISTMAGQMQAAYQDAKGGGANYDKITMLAIAGVVVLAGVMLMRK